MELTFVHASLSSCNESENVVNFQQISEEPFESVNLRELVSSTHDQWK